MIETPSESVANMSGILDSAKDCFELSAERERVGNRRIQVSEAKAVQQIAWAQTAKELISAAVIAFCVMDSTLALGEIAKNIDTRVTLAEERQALFRELERLNDKASTAYERGLAQVAENPSQDPLYWRRPEQVQIFRQIKTDQDKAIALIRDKNMNSKDAYRTLVTVWESRLPAELLKNTFHFVKYVRGLEERDLAAIKHARIDLSR